MTTCNACRVNRHEDCRGGKDGCYCYEERACMQLCECGHYGHEHHTPGHAWSGVCPETRCSGCDDICEGYYPES